MPKQTKGFIYRIKQHKFKFSSKLYLAIWLVNTALCSTWANANQPEELSFEKALSNVESYQQQTGIWQTKEQIAQANLKQSGLWSNPILSAQQTGWQSGQDREFEFEITQPLDLFNSRGAAKHVAQLELDKLELNKQIYREQVRLIVKYLYAQVVVLKQEFLLSQAQLKNSEANLAATKLRYQAGSISKLDYDRALVAQIENQRLAQQIELNLKIAKAQLANLWGENYQAFQAMDIQSPHWPIDTQANVEEYLNRNILAKYLQLQGTQQQADIALLKAKSKPNPNVLLGIVNSKTAQSNASEQQFRVGVEVPLNIFNRQQYQIQSAQAKQRMQQQQSKFYGQQNQQQIDTLLMELDALKQQYDVLNDQLIPLSNTVQQNTLLGFKAGKYSITDVQQASIQLQDQRLKNVQLLKMAWQKSIEVESLALGIDPETVMSVDALSNLNQSLWQSTSDLPAIIGVE